MSALGWTTYKHAFFQQNINFRGRSENSPDYTIHPKTIQISLKEREILGEILQWPELT